MNWPANRDRLLEMQALVAVDAGSFVKAADALQMSKPAVSRVIGELEQRLGARLLHRTTRRLSLTREGELFVERSRALLSDLADAETEVARQTGEAMGELRVGAPVSFGLMHLAPLWPVFMARHPRVTLDVTLTDHFVDLVDEGVDVAVRIAQLPSSSLVSRRIASTRLVLCASPTYLRHHGEPKCPRDLAAHTVVAYKLLYSGEQWTFMGPRGPETVKVTPRMRTNSGDTCCAAALRHQGIVLQPSFMVAGALAAGELVALMPAYRGIELGIYAVYPSRRQPAPRVRLLVDFLVESFQTAGWPA